MNPWGIVLVLVGILMIMIGFTGSQHKILQVFKGIPASARGAPAKQPSNTQPATTTNPGGIV